MKQLFFKFTLTAFIGLGIGAALASPKKVNADDPYFCITGWIETSAVPENGNIIYWCAATNRVIECSPGQQPNQCQLLN